MNKTYKIVGNVVAVVLVLAAVAVVWNMLRSSDYEATDDAQVEQYMAPINVRSAGYIKEIRFKEHQLVKKGDTLVIIDPREYQIAVKVAEATLMEARNGLGSLSASQQTVVSSAGAIDAQIEEARIRVRKLTEDYARFQKLLEQKATTPMVVEEYRTNLEMARVRVQALESQRNAARSQVQEVGQKRTNVEAAILKAEAALEKARLDLDYCVITAPSDGYLGRRTIEEGQLVGTGQTVTTIISGDSKWVTANFKETQIERLRVGQHVSISVDAFKDREFTGKVSAISSATGSKYSMVPTDNSAGNFVKIQQRVPVRIDFEGLTADDNQRLAAGMMCEIKVVVNE
ncbi:MAG: HlyD family secretion protein [Prevotella sp.]|nr:HlyD family secretion protein [Prevotella sp.]